MAVTSGFFNSVDGDRKYNSLEFSQLFDGVFADGVFASYGDSLMVIEQSGMNVIVESGRAWFMGTWTLNNGDYWLVISDSSPSLNRYDYVVLDVDKRDENRVNTLMVVEGTPAGGIPPLPTLASEADHKQYPLALIYIGAGVTEITAENITNQIGVHDDTPFATALLDYVTVETLLYQWEAQFDAWLQNLVDELTENQATNLQAQIDDLFIIPKNVNRNVIDNPNFYIVTDGVAGTHSPIFGPTDPVGQIKQYPKNCPARWLVELRNEDTLQVKTYQNFLEDKYWLTLVVTTSDATLDPNAHLLLTHHMEGYRFSQLQKGTLNARPLQLQFTARSNVAGQYVVELLGNGTQFTQPFTIDTASVSQDFSFEIPPDTSLAPILEDEEVGLSIKFILRAGSNQQVQPHVATWVTDGATRRGTGIVQLGTSGTDQNFQVTNIQLEIGPEMTPFQMPDHDEQLIKCSRYFERLDNPFFPVYLYNFVPAVTFDYRGDVRWMYQKRSADISKITMVDGTNDKAYYIDQEQYGMPYFDISPSGITILSATRNTFQIEWDGTPAVEPAGVLHIRWEDVYYDDRLIT